MNKAASSALGAAHVSVLDGARIPGLAARIKASGAGNRCLFQGSSEEDLSDVAPYLVALKPESDLTQWIFGEGWGASWGIHLVTTASLDEVRAHLRRFLMVLDPLGKQLYFRLYDPRVLRVFLPTCDAEQLKMLFGPIDAFLVENEDPATALAFSLDGDTLQTKTLPALSKILWKGKREKLDADHS